MPSCPASLDLFRFAEGVSTPEERVRVRAHVDGCPGCRALVEEALEDEDLLDELRAALRGPPLDRPSRA